MGPCRALALAGLRCLVAVAALAGCDRGPRAADSATAARPSALPMARHTNAEALPPHVPFDAATPRTAFQPARSWPHDTAAFTEGLLLHDGRLLEGTGLEGQSDVREVDRATGAIRRRTMLPSSMFGEGIAVVGSRLYELTWTNGRGYVYDAATLAPLDSFTFAGEGWGLTTDGARLYLSDGTSRVQVVEPDGFRVVRTFQVKEAGQPVWMLNELEWVRGELWANVYQTDFIARIDPTTGTVVGWIDVGRLLSPDERRRIADRGGVANGIAFDAARGRVLVTGKLWPRLYEMPLDAPGTRSP